jgi:hypothetical protein
VFGPEAGARVWLALDGDTLYVDRDGDGDLTGPGEEVKLPPMRPVGDSPVLEAGREANLGDVKEGRLTHKGLTFEQLRVRKILEPRTEEEREAVRLLGGVADREVVGLRLSVDLGGEAARRVTQGALADHRGVLRFAGKAKDAPVVHFNGPWSMGLRPAQRLVRGGKPADLRACVGTPGLGSGTFATAVYEGVVPEGVHPVAEVTFPARPGAGPLRTARVELDQRC